jgi:transposase-like protein
MNFSQSHRKHYPRQLKLAVVDAIKSGESVSDVAIKFNLKNKQTVYNILHWWRNSGVYGFTCEGLVNYVLKNSRFPPPQPTATVAETPTLACENNRTDIATASAANAAVYGRGIGKSSRAADNLRALASFRFKLPPPLPVSRKMNIKKLAQQLTSSSSLLDLLTIDSEMELRGDEKKITMVN